MANIAAFELLAALVSVSAFNLFVLAIACIAATIISSSPDHYIAGNLDVHDSKRIFSLYAHVSGDP